MKIPLIELIAGIFSLGCPFCFAYDCTEHISTKTENRTFISITLPYHRPRFENDTLLLILNLDLFYVYAILQKSIEKWLLASAYLSVCLPVHPPA
jgi:hypothetical protein